MTVAAVVPRAASYAGRSLVAFLWAAHGVDRAALGALVLVVVSLCWTPALLSAFARWPRVALGLGLGKTRTNRAGRELIYGLPTMRRWRVNRYGWAVQMRLRYGDTFDTIAGLRGELEAAWRGTVRVARIVGKPHRVRLVVLRRDPFRLAVPAPRALSSTRFAVGRCEDGRPFVVDLDEAPHWLCAGATGSGKSGGQAALAAAVCESSAALVVVDLKHGVSAEPMRPRASLIAETRVDTTQLLRNLLELGASRAYRCKAAGVDHVRDLDQRPPEVVVLVDEVAELAVTGNAKAEKDEAAECMTLLLRCVQMLRFAGIHVVISGQRFGSSLGASITNVRAQLPGRICYRVNDRETADMTVGDVGKDAIAAAVSIPITLPGVAVASGGPNGWRLVRMAKVSHRQLAEAAAANADRRVDWAELMAEVLR